MNGVRTQFIHYVYYSAFHLVTLHLVTLVVVTLLDGVWKRSYPSRPGELDCEESNLVTLAALQGLAQEEPSRENPE